MAIRWIKLWIDALDDPKLDKLTDIDFRLFIKLLLLAGQLEEGGKIPGPRSPKGYSREALAKRLNCPRTALDHAVNSLRSRNVLSVNQAGNITFINWETRQHHKPSDEPERIAKRVGRYRGVTKALQDSVTNINVTPSIKNKSKDKEPPYPPEGGRDFLRVKQAYERDFGLLVPLLGKEIEAALGRWPVDWIIEALQIAVERNARSWAYAKAILERWEAEGRARADGGIEQYVAKDGHLIGIGRTFEDVLREEAEYEAKLAEEDLRRLAKVKAGKAGG